MMPEFYAEYPNGTRKVWALNVDEANDKAQAIWGTYPAALHPVGDEK